MTGEGTTPEAQHRLSRSERYRALAGRISEAAKNASAESTSNEHRWASAAGEVVCQVVDDDFDQAHLLWVNNLSPRMVATLASAGVRPNSDDTNQYGIRFRISSEKPYFTKILPQVYITQNVGLKFGPNETRPYMTYEQFESLAEQAGIFEPKERKHLGLGGFLRRIIDRFS